MSTNTLVAIPARSTRQSRGNPEPCTHPDAGALNVDQARRLWCAQLARACVESLRGRLAPTELRRSATAEAVAELFAHSPARLAPVKVTGVRQRETALGAWEVVVLLEAAGRGQALVARVIPRPNRRELAPGCRSTWVATNLRML